MATKFHEVKPGEKFVCRFSEMLYEKVDDTTAICRQPGNFNGQPDEFEASDPVLPPLQSIAVSS